MTHLTPPALHHRLLHERSRWHRFTSDSRQSGPVRCSRPARRSAPASLASDFGCRPRRRPSCRRDRRRRIFPVSLAIADYMPTRSTVFPTTIFIEASSSTMCTFPPGGNPERLDYTKRLADILAVLLPESEAGRLDQHVADRLARRNQRSQTTDQAGGTFANWPIICSHSSRARVARSWSRSSPNRVAFWIPPTTSLHGSMTLARSESSNLHLCCHDICHSRYDGIAIRSVVTSRGGRGSRSARYK